MGIAGQITKKTKNNIKQIGECNSVVIRDSIRLYCI